MTTSVKPGTPLEDFNNRHCVRDKEEIHIDRRQFQMTRSPKSTEDVEIILITAIPQKEEKGKE